MNKFLIILTIIAAVVFGNYKGEVLAVGDLCGGTGGNGEVISIGNNSFTLKLNEGSNKGLKEGGNLIVSLTSRATIKTPTGNVSLSDLKIGDRVTLVGDSHRDGTFSADTVVVCNKVQQIGSPENGATTPRIAVRNENPKAYEKVNGTIKTITLLIIGFIWLGLVEFLVMVKKKNLVYLLFFTIFYVYLYKVIDYTLLQFQSLLLLQHFVPGLQLRGVEAGQSLNLIPLVTLTLRDIKTSLLNILMMMPFGFGLPFITNWRMKKVVVVGLLLSVAIELLQFVTGFMANTTFRIADINDLIFNTIGVATGYVLFVGFVGSYRKMSRNWKISTNPILQYIAKRP